ncbi:phage tail tape measure protein [Nocardia sp. NPDC004415]
MSTKVGEIYAELSLDDSRFKKTLDNSERQFATLRQTAQRAGQQVDQSFRDTGDSVRRMERAADEAGQATRRIEVPSSLAADARRAAEAVGEIGDRAEEVGDAGGQAGGNFKSGFADKIKGLGGKGGPIAMALVGVAAVGVAAGAVLADALSDGMQMEADRDLIQARLDLDDETMARIGAAAGDAFTNGWGESVTENLNTAQTLMQSGLLDGTESAGQMQPLIEKLTAVTELLGTDMVEATKAASIMLKTGLAADADEAFDLILQGSRKVGLAGDDLIDSIKEYSSGWKNAGLTGQEVMALLAQSTAKLGADSTDRAADGLRELGRRISEEGEAMVEGLDAIGLSGQEMYDALKAGGPAAFDTLDQIFDKLREIEDPAERNAAILALLGDTAGDFYDVFANMDPSEALKDFGDVAGEVDQAMQTMGDNSAAHLQAARNSITASMDDVKLAIAEAFGPTISKAADWVSTHKPEIIGFFVALADAGFATLDGIIGFTSGALRAFADLQEGIGDTVGKGIEALGAFAEKAGGIIKHIPGMEGIGKAIESAGKMANGFGSAMDDAADRARGMADALDRTRPTIQGMRDHVADAGQTAVNAAEMTRLFGSAVDALPSGKSLVVEAVTEDAKARLREFGFRVEDIPGTKQTTITAETAAAQQLIDDFVKANDGRQIRTYTVNEIQDRRAEWTGSPTGPQKQGPVPMAPGEWRADGGIDLDRLGVGKLPDQAEIKPATGRLIQWAEPSTGGEAYIPLAPAKRARSLSILAEVAQRFGLDGIEAYGMGGFGGLGQDGNSGAHLGSWEVSQLGDRDGVPLSTPGRAVPAAAWGSSAYRAAAFAAGAASAVASGWSEDGTFQGFDTSSNSPAAFTAGLEKGFELLGEKLDELIAGQQTGAPVEVDVDIDSGRRAAEIAIKQHGI